MIVLLACPFCGHQPVDLAAAIRPMTYDRDDDGWAVGCGDEGGCNSFTLAGTRAEAIAKWNHRNPMNWRDAQRLRNAVNRD